MLGRVFQFLGRGKFRRSLARSVLIGALILTAVTGASQQSPTTTTVNINVATGAPGVVFDPNSISIATGSRVKWVNQSGTSVNLSSSQLGFGVNLPSQGSFAYLFQNVGSYPVTASAGSANATMSVNVTAGPPTLAPAPGPTPAPTQGVQEFALIYSPFNLKIYPAGLTVQRGFRVRLFNTSSDGLQLTVTISNDEEGLNPVFGVRPFSVEIGQVRAVEFTPNQTGTFFIVATTNLRGQNTVGKLVVTGGP